MKSKKIIFIIMLICAVVLIAGIFIYNRPSVEKIKPGIVKESEQSGFVPDKTANAGIQTITEWYEAVGTVRPRTESSIEAQVTAQVVDVKVRPGAKVQKGQLLVSLDNRQFISRLDQAKQGLKTANAGKEQARQSVIGAEAAFKQAEADYNRTKKYFESHAATSQQLEQAESAYLQAKAALTRAKEAMFGSEAAISQAGEIIREAEIGLGYTTIKAHEDGEVLRRLVEPGDLALPGKPLIILQTAGASRLEAYVREGLIDKVKIGTNLKADIKGKTAEATVEEIVPYADPQTRTFLVKASITNAEGIYPGMFGKLLIPVQNVDVVVIPEAGIRNVGQLELVSVMENNTWKTRFIKTGRKIGDKVEVLSGLSGNETIGIRN